MHVVNIHASRVELEGDEPPSFGTGVMVNRSDAAVPYFDGETAPD